MASGITSSALVRVRHVRQLLDLITLFIYAPLTPSPGRRVVNLGAREDCRRHTPAARHQHGPVNAGPAGWSRDRSVSDVSRHRPISMFDFRSRGDPSRREPRAAFRTSSSRVLLRTRRSVGAVGAWRHHASLTAATCHDSTRPATLLRVVVASSQASTHSGRNRSARLRTRAARNRLALTAS